MIKYKTKKEILEILNASMFTDFEYNRRTRPYKRTTKPLTDDDIYIITQYGDRLDLLANTYYNDPTLWWYIAKANGLKVMNVPEGTSLRIPGSTTYATGR